ncbi:MAG: DMT family transporter [Rhodobacter sp.]|nr:DMT family transporter [Paracoccaceae bacterium]MCC0075689.1 DMT family transporter [Rhodobacter sp.]
MSPQTLVALIVVAAAGVALATQGMLNAALGRAAGSSLVAATVSFGVGFIALMTITLLTGEGGGFGRLGSIRPWLLFGGLMGAFYVWSIAWGVPTLGVVSAFAALILGQMIAALLFDASGAFGLAVHDITWKRIVAVALVAAGMVMSRI